MRATDQTRRLLKTTGRAERLAYADAISNLTPDSMRIWREAQEDLAVVKRAIQD